MDHSRPVSDMRMVDESFVTRDEDLRNFVLTRAWREQEQRAWRMQEENVDEVEPHAEGKPEDDPLESQVEAVSSSAPSRRSLRQRGRAKLFADEDY